MSFKEELAAYLEGKSHPLHHPSIRGPGVTAEVEDTYQREAPVEDEGPTIIAFLVTLMIAIVVVGITAGIITGALHTAGQATAHNPNKAASK